MRVPGFIDDYYQVTLTASDDKEIKAIGASESDALEKANKLLAEHEAFIALPLIEQLDAICSKKRLSLLDLENAIRIILEMEKQKDAGEDQQDIAWHDRFIEMRNRSQQHSYAVG